MLHFCNIFLSKDLIFTHLNLRHVNWLLKKLLPDYHKKFKGWEAKSENPFSIEEKEEEKRATMTVREKLDEKNSKRKLEREMLRQELQKPIDMPEIEMSDCEILREKNIAEIKQFMRDSGLFDD